MDDEGKEGDSQHHIFISDKTKPSPATVMPGMIMKAKLDRHWRYVKIEEVNRTSVLQPFACPTHHVPHLQQM